jgi:hypothetical protein
MKTIVKILSLIMMVILVSCSNESEIQNPQTTKVICPDSAKLILSYFMKIKMEKEKRDSLVKETTREMFSKVNWEETLSKEFKDQITEKINNQLRGQGMNVIALRIEIDPDSEVISDNISTENYSNAKEEIIFKIKPFVEKRESFIEVFLITFILIYLSTFWLAKQKDDSLKSVLGNCLVAILLVSIISLLIGEDNITGSDRAMPSILVTTFVAGTVLLANLGTTIIVPICSNYRSFSTKENFWIFSIILVVLEGLLYFSLLKSILLLGVVLLALFTRWCKNYLVQRKENLQNKKINN